MKTDSIKIKICFYSSFKLQGWRKLVIAAMQGTKHTHVHIEIMNKTHNLVLLTVDGGSPRIIKLGLNKKFLGLDPYYSVSVTLPHLSPSWFDFVVTYKPTHHWQLIWYQIKRYFGLENKTKIPPTCTTFVSDFLFLHDIEIPTFFSPKELWRYFHDGNNVWR
jgi:hypothetical protein